MVPHGQLHSLTEQRTASYLVPSHPRDPDDSLIHGVAQRLPASVPETPLPSTVDAVTFAHQVFQSVDLKLGVLR